MYVLFLTATKVSSRKPMNSTSPFVSGAPTTYADYFNDIAAYNVHLNVFEKAWAAWYAYMQNDVLATGIMSFTMHEVVYFGRALPFIIMDKIPYFRKYKIQAVRAPVCWLQQGLNADIRGETG
ncbi:putative C-4 methyl sterol oxidase [Cladophialophora carrionii]|uniref:Putative C-4 methyl sterol oxidase n=1 Tax=Cladophialophora carrionii TaxID=86049 RepID=A0A1C1CS33_9EURO|nr:putative C-4 methyl sterol oxidase [Cladophialophora carrionii]